MFIEHLKTASKGLHDIHKGAPSLKKKKYSRVHAVIPEALRLLAEN